jgi:hypothetical protein
VSPVITEGLLAGIRPLFGFEDHEQAPPMAGSLIRAFEIAASRLAVAEHAAAHVRTTFVGDAHGPALLVHVSGRGPVAANIDAVVEVQATLAEVVADARAALLEMLGDEAMPMICVVGARSATRRC